MSQEGCEECNDVGCSKCKEGYYLNLTASV